MKRLLSGYVVGNMSAGIADLGGAVVDLNGGYYLLSAPLFIPSYYGNVHVQSGELRATASFPTNESVLTVGTGCSSAAQGSCNENVGLHSLTLDGSHVAAGCLKITSTMGSVLDGSSAVFGFTQAGIALDGGHEAMISDTWIAAYFWDSPMKEKTNATGIAVNGNDHYVTDVIVFSARVGVSLAGAANILTGVHTWNCATGNGGTGILNSMSQNRFDGCYLDYNDMVLEGSGAQETTVLDGFFLGGGAIVFRATPSQHTVQSVAIQGNEWYASNAPPLAVDESQAAWTAVSNLVVSGVALPSGQPYVGPSATLVQSSVEAPSDVWSFNFTSALLFPHVPIDVASVAVQLSGNVVEGNKVPAVIANYTAGTGHVLTVYAPGTLNGPYTMRASVSQSVDASTQHQTI